MCRIVNVEEPFHEFHAAALTVVVFDEGPDDDYTKLDKGINFVYAKEPDECVEQNPFFHVKDLFGKAFPVDVDFHDCKDCYA